VPGYVIEITLARIEYVKSVGAPDDSEEPKVICLLFFTSESGDCRTAALQSSQEGATYPNRKVLSLEIFNEPLFDFMRLVEFRGRFLNVGFGAVALQ
jgi:hypothetical protein